MDFEYGISRTLFFSGSGRAARFGGGSPVGDGSFVAPTMVSEPHAEQAALEPVVEVVEEPESAN